MLLVLPQGQYHLQTNCVHQNTFGPQAKVTNAVIDVETVLCWMFDVFDGCLFCFVWRFVSLTLDNATHCAVFVLFAVHTFSNSKQK